MDSGNVSIAVALVAFAGLIVFLMAFNRSRSASMLADWARGQGVELVSEERCHFLKGPYFWTSSKSQVVFRVSVRDRQGRVRSGWVRCGSFIGGLLSDQVDVRWDD